jgi:U1 snRNP-specific protein C
MGKKYFCEYCEKSMADNYESRKKHLNSVNHKLLVKLHYNQYRGKYLHNYLLNCFDSSMCHLTVGLDTVG